ncbi:MAG: 50S ribosomal protein L4 [Puniceicoccales bacterium]|nr:50S ribosomal protein L4 [Puniceicoccales bacterium]
MAKKIEGVADMKLRVYSSSGELSSEKEVTALAVFDDGRGVNAVKFVLDILLSNKRQGNASTKTHSDVSGSGRKPYKQKGTGNARHGSIRSPLWCGGGVVFGPHPRSYYKKINKKVKKLALGRAMYDGILTSELSAIESFPQINAKSRTLVEFINKIYPSNGDKVLVIDTKFSHEFVLASRNCTKIYTIDAASVNALDLIRYDRYLVSEEAFDVLINRAGI